MDPPGLIEGGGKVPRSWAGGEETEKLKNPPVKQKLVAVTNAGQGWEDAQELRVPQVPLRAGQMLPSPCHASSLPEISLADGDSETASTCLPSDNPGVRLLRSLVSHCQQKADKIMQK